MIEVIGEAAMFEQLAEEASELAQAASKMSRKMRGENPTPLSYTELLHNFREEVTDVTDCLDDISHHYDMSLYDEEIHKEKMERFKKRINAMKSKFIEDENKELNEKFNSKITEALITRYSRCKDEDERKIFMMQLSTLL